MDFRFSDDQQSIGALAREILEKEVTLERLKAVEQGEDGFDRALWATLAEANLLGLAVPEEHGGSGFGLLELCLLLEAIGRSVAPLPALSALVGAGLPIAAFGSERQQQRWLAPLAAGEALLTAALDAVDVSARRVGDGDRDGGAWILDGSARGIPLGDLADAVLVPAAAEGGPRLFLVEPGAKGVTLAPKRLATGDRIADLTLAAVRLDGDSVLAGPPDPAWLRDRALVGACALQLGVSQRALEITARYVSEREQFGVPIGTFQAVQHRAADGYVDLECMRWTTWRAAWKLAEGRDASRDAAVAKFWAAEGGARIAASAQHLHAGLGVDRDYPIHRYFLRSKSLELFAGAGTPQLRRLGRDMARTGPPELA
ncbi:MAG: acyl-CoA/acyl-ACP dehydrogenase [Proteobacteria bacterium]|nr:acyl-CoA/acyl-ACP dehydrogenase [Pseudomonadota bacterium]